jgi:2-keto-3-deoxy-L-rhamnonate aldolase RhmA
VPVGEFALASRLLDAGAPGILAPMINSRDDGRRLVAFTKYEEALSTIRAKPRLDHKPRWL